MKKIFLCCCAVLLLSSCSQSNKLIGKWEPQDENFAELEFTSSGELIYLFQYDNNSETQRAKYNIIDSEKLEIIIDSDDSNGQINQFLYRIDGNRLMLASSEGSLFAILWRPGAFESPDWKEQLVGTWQVGKKETPDFYGHIEIKSDGTFVSSVDGGLAGTWAVLPDDELVLSSNFESIVYEMSLTFHDDILEMQYSGRIRQEIWTKIKE